MAALCSCRPQGKRPNGESVENRVGPWQTATEWRDKLLLPVAPPSELPPPLPVTCLGPGRLSLRPARAYLQAIGRPGAETAPAARGFQLPPHPRPATPLAAVRAAALLGGSLTPGPAARFRAPGGRCLAGSCPRGAVNRPRRGGAGPGTGRPCSAGTKRGGGAVRAGGGGLRH